MTTPHDLCCGRLPATFPGASVHQIPALQDRCDEIPAPSADDARYFRCRQCGQLWKESFAARAFADVPETTKVWSIPTI